MSATNTTDTQGVLLMLNPIATAGSAEVRALVHAADPVEPLLDTLDEHLIGGSADASVDPSPQTAPGAQLALLAARTPAGLTLAAAQRPSDRFEGVQVAGSTVILSRCHRRDSCVGRPPQPPGQHRSKAQRWRRRCARR